MAVHHILVGNLDRALDELEAALQHKVGMMVFLHKDPAVDPVRTHPRFGPLIQRVIEAGR